MLGVLRKNLIEGLTIVSIKELSTKYQIVFDYEGDTAKAELPKTCIPGCQDKVANQTIITAMSTIYFNRGDFIKAKEWLDKLTENNIN